MILLLRLILFLLAISVPLVLGRPDPTLARAETTEPIQCTFCASRFSWDNCTGEGVQANCGDEVVNATHHYLAQYNPGLEDSEKGDFQCFRLKIELFLSCNVVYMSGCTYKQANFCDGWTNNGSSLAECSIGSTDEQQTSSTSGATVLTSPCAEYLPTSAALQNSTVTTESPVTTEAGRSGAGRVGQFLVVGIVLLLLLLL
ncbi:uncharacterized protein LOC131685738 [Topomyia yanbarensis]|uniref:uncharacterized protein LOC131685738 n=1 Tax=Topomyia yanbarensis TaxID=2498891 RepID=UPI00273B54BD|nr:uncharacterized protein LOC131685738 [Topomyia yanbarensis]